MSSSSSSSLVQTSSVQFTPEQTLSVLENTQAVKNKWMTLNNLIELLELWPPSLLSLQSIGAINTVWKQVAEMREAFPLPPQGDPSWDQEPCFAEARKRRDQLFHWSFAKLIARLGSGALQLGREALREAGGISENRHPVKFCPKVIIDIEDKGVWTVESEIFLSSVLVSDLIDCLETAFQTSFRSFCYLEIGTEQGDGLEVRRIDDRCTPISLYFDWTTGRIHTIWLGFNAWKEQYDNHEDFTPPGWNAWSGKVDATLNRWAAITAQLSPLLPDKSVQYLVLDYFREHITSPCKTITHIYVPECVQQYLQFLIQLQNSDAGRLCSLQELSEMALDYTLNPRTVEHPAEGVRKDLLVGSDSHQALSLRCLLDHRFDRLVTWMPQQAFLLPDKIFEEIQMKFPLIDTTKEREELIKRDPGARIQLRFSHITIIKARLDVQRTPRTIEIQKKQVKSSFLDGCNLVLDLLKRIKIIFDLKESDSLNIYCFNTASFRHSNMCLEREWENDSKDSADALGPKNFRMFQTPHFLSLNEYFGPALRGGEYAGPIWSIQVIEGTNYITDLRDFQKKLNWLSEDTPQIMPRNDAYRWPDYRLWRSWTKGVHAIMDRWNELCQLLSPYLNSEGMELVLDWVRESPPPKKPAESVAPSAPQPPVRPTSAAAPELASLADLPLPPGMRGSASGANAPSALQLNRPLA